MPSSPLSDDEPNGDADPPKIPTTQMWKWADLVELRSTKSSSVFAIATPMKRSVRPIFSLVLLIALGATLTCRVMTRHVGGFGFGFGSEEALSVVVQPPAPVFNSTLLKYAAVDIGEPRAKKEIEQLMDGNFGSSGRYRSFANWRRFSTRDISSSSSSRGMAMTMRSPQLYRYWLEFRRLLSRWSRDLRYQPQVMDELVELVKVPVERDSAGSPDSRMRYGSCAVVGNSGILLQKEYGAVIDGHDAVIRLNNARIQRFEKNVGAKTTISFINSNILHLCSRRQDCFCHPYGASVPIVMYICQPVHFLDYTVCNSSHKAPLIVTDPRFDVLCTRIVKYYSLKRFAMETGKSLDEWGSAHDGSMFHYSSGMQAVMLAVGMCDRVSVFGFGKSTSAKHHYHTNQKAELHLHDYQAEYDFYHDLVNHPRAIPFVPESFKFPPVTIYQ